MPKAQRLENKKRKIQAFLEIAQLNDAEGRKRSSMQVAPVKKPKLEKDSHGEEDIKDSDQSFSTNCESLDELRERLRERKKKFQLRPHFDLKTKGHDASLDLPQNMRTPLFMKDLQGLLLYAMLGSEAPVEPSRWCKFQQWSKLSHIQCLIVDGLGLTDFAQCEELKSICDFKLEFVSPSSYGSNVADDLSILPLSSKRQKELIQAYRSIEKACSQGQAFKVFRSMFKVKESSEKSTEVREESLKMKLMLSLTQLLEEKYPLPIKPCLQTLYKDFKFSQEEYKQVDEKSPLYAIDCEMCLTTSGQLELTKICVIDSNLQEVYQSFVKPRNKIVNYLTRFSGVTATSLENVTTCLEDVQEELKRILPPDAIWIGQSLNCDLNALKLFHPYVIDTSVIYNISGESGRKTSLKTLAHMFLGEEIQDKQGEGHDPKEDAMAAMKLVLLKVSFIFSIHLQNLTFEHNFSLKKATTLVTPSGTMSVCRVVLPMMANLK